jgi:hypothetical protein
MRQCQQVTSRDAIQTETNFFLHCNNYLLLLRTCTFILQDCLLDFLMPMSDPALQTASRWRWWCCVLCALHLWTIPA